VDASIVRKKDIIANQIPDPDELAGGWEWRMPKVPKMPKVVVSLCSGIFKKAFTLAVRETRNQNIEIPIYREPLI